MSVIDSGGTIWLLFAGTAVAFGITVLTSLALRIFRPEFWAWTPERARIASRSTTCCRRLWLLGNVLVSFLALIATLVAAFSCNLLSSQEEYSDVPGIYVGPLRSYYEESRTCKFWLARDEEYWNDGNLVAVGVYALLDTVFAAAVFLISIFACMEGYYTERRWSFVVHGSCVCIALSPSLLQLMFSKELCRKDDRECQAGPGSYVALSAMVLWGLLFGSSVAWFESITREQSETIGTTGQRSQENTRAAAIGVNTSNGSAGVDAYNDDDIEQLRRSRGRAEVDNHGYNVGSSRSSRSRKGRDSRSRKSKAPSQKERPNRNMASIEKQSSNTPEEVSIFKDDKGRLKKSRKIQYTDPSGVKVIESQIETLKCVGAPLVSTSENDCGELVKMIVTEYVDSQGEITVDKHVEVLSGSISHSDTDSEEESKHEIPDIPPVGSMHNTTSEAASEDHHPPAEEIDHNRRSATNIDDDDDDDRDAKTWTCGACSSVNPSSLWSCRACLSSQPTQVPLSTIPGEASHQAVDENEADRPFTAISSSSSSYRAPTTTVVQTVNEETNEEDNNTKEEWECPKSKSRVADMVTRFDSASKGSE